MQKTRYHLVRKILNISCISLFAGLIGIFILPTKTLKKLSGSIALGSVISVATIFIEDISHTKTQVKKRTMDSLASQLHSWDEYPDLYMEFEEYLKTIVTEWIPDRDYEGIGYLPKKRLEDKSLGMDISTYWPEASDEERKEYAALKFDDLVWNTQISWTNFVLQRKLEKKN